MRIPIALGAAVLCGVAALVIPLPSSPVDPQIADAPVEFRPDLPKSPHPERPVGRLAPAPVPQEPLAEFAAWRERFASTPPEDRPALLRKGLTLAKERRKSMAKLIRQDPAQALASSLRWHEWVDLPPQIQAVVEQPFSTTGSFDHLSDCRPLEARHEPFHPYLIEYSLDGNESHLASAHLYGRRLETLSESGLPLQGILLDDQAALWEEPLFKLDEPDYAAVAERFPHANSKEHGTDHAVLMGGQIYHFQTALERDRALIALERAEDRLSPHGVREVIAAAFGEDGFDEGIAEAAAAAAESKWTETDKSVYVLNILFADSEDYAMSNELLRDRVAKSSDHIAGQSFGKTKLNLAGITNVRLTKDWEYYSDDGKKGHRGGEIGKDALEVAGLDSKIADIIVYAFPNLGKGAPAWASLGGQGHSVNGSRVESIFVHEFGHNYGLGHANFRFDLVGTGPQLNGHKNSSDKPAEHHEYGDPFDIMGPDRQVGVYPAGHFHARGKARLNWIPSTRYHDVTNSGRYRIYAFDHANALAGTGQLGLRVQSPDGSTYWVGFRAGFPEVDGKNAPVGATIVHEFGSTHNLIDATVWSNDDLTQDRFDAALPVGMTWTDASGHIRIRCSEMGGQLPSKYLELDVSVSGEQPWHLFTDGSLSTPGLTGRYLSFSRGWLPLGNDFDWTATDYPSSRTRIDPEINFPDRGSWGPRAAVGIMNGTDADWNSFSVQWDGVIQIKQATKLRVRADDEARMLIDYNQDGTFSTSGGPELVSKEQNKKGFSPTLSPGIYRIRIQYAEGGHNNYCVLESSQPVFEFETDSGEPGLTGSYLWKNLRASTSLDWSSERDEQRKDLLPFFYSQNWNSPELERESWDLFSVQWDGVLRVHQQINVITRSDDSSRFMIDHDQSGDFTEHSPREVWNNDWGTAHGSKFSPEVGSYHPGTYRFRAQYEEGEGDNVFQFFGRSVQDDHGHDQLYASHLANDTTVRGELTAGDTDYFRFELTSNSDVLVQSVGPTDTFASLTNEGGEVLHSDDDSGESTNFSISRNLPAGVYYLHLRGYDPATTGEYALQYFSTPTVPSLYLARTHLLEVGTRGQEIAPRTIHITNEGTGPLNYAITSPLPWWLSVTPPSGSLAPDETQGLELFYNTSTLGGGSHRAEFIIEDPDFPETKRVLKLTVLLDGPADDHGGHPQTAKLLPSRMGVSNQGELEVEQDEDWFRFDISEEGTMELWSTGEVDLIATLYAADGETRLAGVDDLGPSDRNFRLLHDASPGTYYLCVSGYADATGDYEIHANFHSRILPLTLEVARQDNDRSRISFDTRSGRFYHLIASEDLERWNLLGNTVSGDGGPVSETLRPNSLGFSTLFFRVVESPGKLLFASNFHASDGAEESTQITGATAGFRLDLGTPPNMGDTALTLDHQPLAQNHGVTMMTIGSRDHFGGIVQAPGELTDNTGSFPAGVWVATNLPDGSEIAPTNVNLAHFPFGAGWAGGHVRYTGEVLKTANLPAGFQIAQQGEGLFQLRDPNNVITPLNGALFAIGAENLSTPNVVNTRQLIIPDVGFGWQIGVAEATAGRDTFHAADWSFVYLPYTTKDLVVGRMLVSGRVDKSSRPVHSFRDNSKRRYTITIPSLDDLSQGTLLLTGMDSDSTGPRNVHFEWEVSEDKQSIHVTPYRLPLTQETKAWTGFTFAFIPHDRVVLHPGN